MEYLLDTHTFLWFLGGEDHLSLRARRMINDSDVVKYISVVSFWEIAIKVSLGKLELDLSYESLRKHASFNGFIFLPLTFEHTIELVELNMYHRDPFDRMLISQALVERLTLISKDDNFKKYRNLRLYW